MKSKPTVLFFSRTYHASLFPLFRSNIYNSIHATLTRSEKKIVENLGGVVCGCFEEDFDNLSEASLSDNYLLTSWASDRFLKGKTLDERKLILSKEISFWHRIINRYKPIIVFNEVIAIEISEVLYIESIKNDIKYLGWLPGLLPNTFYWLTNPMHSSLDEQVFKKEPDIANLLLAEGYIQSVLINKEKPFYVKNLKSRYHFRSFLGILKSILKESFKAIFNAGFNYEKYLSYRIEELKNILLSLIFNYDSLTKLEENECILYPLHFEPEATLSYFSEFFSNQILVIENISKCLKTDQILVLKEHPQQKGMLFSKRYRKLKKSFPNIIFLPGEIPSELIIKSMKSVITLTSTLGWESIIYDVPVVILGKTFYDKYSMINIFNGWDDLRNLIRTDSYKYPIRDLTVRYAAQLIQYSQEGKPWKHDQMTDKQNLQSIILTIEKIVLNY